MAVDTLGQLIAMTVTLTDEQEHAQVKALCEAVQEATGKTVRLAWADQSYIGEQAKQDAQSSGIDLQIVKLPDARKGFVLLPRRWVVERSFGWLSRFRWLSCNFERLPQVLTSLHFEVFAILMLPKASAVLASGGSSQHTLVWPFADKFLNEKTHGPCVRTPSWYGTNGQLKSDSGQHRLCFGTTLAHTGHRAHRRTSPGRGSVWPLCPSWQ